MNNIENKTNEELVTIGRETGNNLLEQAVRTAKSGRQLDNQIFICESAAIYILGHIRANNVHSELETTEQFDKRIAARINVEYEMMDDEIKAGNTEFVSPDKPQTNPNKEQLN